MAEYRNLGGLPWTDGKTVRGMRSKMGFGESSDRDKYGGERVGTL